MTLTHHTEAWITEDSNKTNKKLATLVNDIFTVLYTYSAAE